MHLTIHIQHGNGFRASKTARRQARNLEAATTWASYLLCDLSNRHSKILVVSYKEYASILWERLKKFHHCLIPYIDSNGHPKDILPYFGGMNGSNLYAESTCVICLGLNRFEPRDYISRALALDFDGSGTAEIHQMLEDPRRKNEWINFLLSCISRT